MIDVIRKGDDMPDNNDPNFAVQPPRIGRSDYEKEALIALYKKYGWELPKEVTPPMTTDQFIEQTAPPKVDPKPEPKPDPTFLQQAIDHEQRRLTWEAQQIMNSIQPKPEPTE
jgi:hypothetical protein